MPDVSREKYLRMMAEIEDLEEKVESLRSSVEAVRQSDPSSAEQIRKELGLIEERLEALNRELQRVSDGCGRPQAR